MLGGDGWCLPEFSRTSGPLSSSLSHRVTTSSIPGADLTCYPTTRSDSEVTGRRCLSVGLSSPLPRWPVAAVPLPCRHRSAMCGGWGGPCQNRGARVEELKGTDED